MGWQLATIDEATETLRIGRTKIYAMIGAGELSVVKIGRRTLLKVSELEALAVPERTPT